MENTVVEKKVRRRDARFFAPVLCALPKSSSRPVIDISPTGLRIYTDVLYNIGQSMSLVLQFENGEDPIYCEGSVRWIGLSKDSKTVGYQTGFSLHFLSPKDPSRLNTFIENWPLVPT